ncbi:Type II secretion envelope pseudopilin protein (PulG,guides folded protein to PulD in outer membrane) [hydrothermal vent metagenome]|uniref:Type II secretion envelope pseudopilin protein (PulG,guides folded protein to PulD in outer membrane) n=1 Tax=hydrothermal vent metagenome TaxID=652676 RepID=A0A1W1BJJ6_9ZZZZ
MQKSRTAFTMIELIFVIVILGILAAVAIPKLSATRNDAEVSKMAQNIMTGLAEISTYAVSQAQTESNLSKMSNAIAFLEKSGEAVIDKDEKKATVKVGAVSDCITVQVQTGDYDDNLTISTGDAGGDYKCNEIQTIIDVSRYPMRLRGTNVKY